MLCGVYNSDKRCIGPHAHLFDTGPRHALDVIIYELCVKSGSLGRACVLGGVDGITRWRGME